MTEVIVPKKEAVGKRPLRLKRLTEKSTTPEGVCSFLSVKRTKMSRLSSYPHGREKTFMSPARKFFL
jgi:hypothetical protein